MEIIKKKKIVISWGDSSEIGRRVAKMMGAKFIKPVFRTFANWETGIWIKENLTNADEIIIIKSLIKPINDSIIDLLLVNDIINRNSDAKVVAVIPWLSYSPQDKIFRKGEPLSSEVIINLVNSTKISKTYVFDIHSESVLPFFKKPVKNIIPYELFVDHLQGLIDESCVCVALDKGGKKRAQKFAKMLKLPFTQLNKTRDLVTGKVTYFKSRFNFNGKTTIAFDDYTGTGQTLIDSAKLLKSYGAKKCVYCITHIFDNNVPRKMGKSKVDLLITTNASVRRNRIHSKKIKILDISKLIYEIL